MPGTASSASRRLLPPSLLPRRRLPFSRGQEAHYRAVAAALAAGDPDGRAGRGRGPSFLRPPLLAGARPRPADRRLRRGRLCAGRSDAGDRQHRGRRAARDALVRRRRRARRREAGGVAASPDCVCRRADRVRPVPGACLLLCAPGDRLARARRPLRARRGVRGRRRGRVAQTRLPARAGGLRPFARIDGDAWHHLLPRDSGDGPGTQCRQRPGGGDRAAGGRRRSLARRRARVVPALLRPGRPVRVGPPTEEEPRCRPTSCSRA